MADIDYEKNMPVQAPGLAVDGGDATKCKTSNTFTAKAGGILSLPTATTTLPAMDTSVDAKGNTGVIPLADGGYQRIYTFLGEIDPVSAAVTFSIVHSADMPAQPINVNDINRGNKGDEHKFIVGYLCEQTTGGGAWVPGTNDIDDFNYVLIDNFGFCGA